MHIRQPFFWGTGLLVGGLALVFGAGCGQSVGAAGSGGQDNPAPLNALGAAATTAAVRAPHPVEASAAAISPAATAAASPATRSTPVSVRNAPDTVMTPADAGTTGAAATSTATDPAASRIYPDTSATVGSSTDAALPDQPAAAAAVPQKTAVTAPAQPAESTRQPTAEPPERGDGPHQKVFVCWVDSVVALKPGRCPICRVPMEMTTISNPDPTVCPVSGQKIEHANYGIVDRKVYAFCTPNCVLFMLKNPHMYLTAAQKRAEEAARP